MNSLWRELVCLTHMCFLRLSLFENKFFSLEEYEVENASLTLEISIIALNPW